jgi:hypothetical protein
LKLFLVHHDSPLSDLEIQPNKNLPCSRFLVTMSR